MKKKRVTYGVYNFVEWHAVLKMGKARIKASFTGGAVTTNGVTPASLTTEDPIVQMAIEGSPEFKSGKIKIVHIILLGGDVEMERNPVVAQPKPVEPVKDAEVAAAEAVAEKTEDASDGSDDSDKPDKEPEQKLTEMEFSCSDDAKDYLEEAFGLVRSKLTTRAVIAAAAKEKGIEIVWV